MPVVNNNDPSALFSGDFWTGFAQNPTPTPVIVTYSFPTSLPASDTSVPLFDAASDATFTAFSTAEQAQAIAAMGEWASASGIIFVQVAPGKGDINFSNINFSALPSPSTDGGIGYNPFGDWNSLTHQGFTTDLTYAGDVFMNSQYQNADGTVSYGTMLHEIGHAIGLKHPTQTDDDFSTGVFEDNVLSADDPSITIMSTQVDAQTASDPHLLSLDKAAAAAIYGAAGTGQVITATSGTVTGANSVSSWSWNATTETLTQTAATANDTIHGTSVNDVINAGNGTDYLYGLDGNNTLTGGTSTSSIDYLYGGPNADTLNGGAGTSQLSTDLADNPFPPVYDNTFVAGTGTEVMHGGVGANVFYDGGGVDTIFAQGGKDTFNVTSTSTTITESNPNSDAEIFTSVSYTMPTNVTEMVMEGTGLTGTANNDASNVSLFGDGTDPVTLIAGTGADYMAGGSGNDTLVSGSGNDSLFGGGGANTFVFNSTADTNTYIGDFVEGTDKIDLSGIARTLGKSLTFIGAGPFTHQAGQVESFISGSYDFIEVDTTGSGTANFQITVFDNQVPLQASDLILTNAPCYCAGTRIMTERGEVAVEELAIGDHVMTLSGLPRPIKWIGNRSYGGIFTYGNRKILPVCFKAGSLGAAVPKRDLWVSPNHALFIDDILVAAEDLVNGHSIVQADAVEEVRYFHIELDSHDVILAEGAWAETFVDDDSRMMFHNAQDYFTRYPNDCSTPARFCAPRINEGYELEAIRECISQRGTSPVRHGRSVPLLARPAA